MHEKFLTQTKKEIIHETVFDRIKMDELYREQKHQFLEYINNMDSNQGKGFIE